MPYIFGALLGLNILVMAYFMTVGKPTQTKTVIQAKQELSQPIEFVNNSAQLPPVIGKKE